MARQKCIFCSRTFSSTFQLSKHRPQCRSGIAKSGRRPHQIQNHLALLAQQHSPSYDTPPSPPPLTTEEDPQEREDNPQLSVIRQLSSTMVDIVQKSGSKLTTELIKLIHHPAFNLDLFRDTIKSVKDCKDVVTEHSKSTLVSSGFRPVPLITSISDNNNVSSTIFIRDPLSVINNQLRILDSMSELVYTPAHLTETPRRYPFCPLHSPYFHNLFDQFKRHIYSADSHDSMWNDSDDSSPKSFVTFLQIFTDKTASSLSSSAYTSYPIHCTVLNVTPERREWLINNGLIIIGFLPAAIGKSADDNSYEPNFPSDSDEGCPSPNIIQLEDDVHDTSSTHGREANMIVLQHALKTFMEPLENIATTGHTIKMQDSSLWNWFPLLTSYCCDIPEAKNVFTIKHGTSSPMPCVRCTSPQSNFKLYCKHSPRSRDDTMKVRRSISISRNCIDRQERPSIRSDIPPLPNHISSMLHDLSLAEWASFLEESPLLPESVIRSMYDIYGFEPLHNNSLGTSVKIKIALMYYLSATSSTAQVNGRSRTYMSIRKQVLRGCNTVLRFFEQHYVMPGVRLDFSKKECSSQLNGIYTSTGLRGMLEGKDYRNLDYFFPFVYAYVDGWLGNHDTAPLTSIHTKYTDIMQQLYSDNHGFGWNDQALVEFNDTLHHFKTDMTSLFQVFCPTDMGTLKYHLLDHIIDDLSKFGSIRLLSASPYEHFNLQIKAAYASTSKRIRTRDVETNNILNFNLARRTLHETTSTTRVSPTTDNSVTSQLGLVNYGETVSLLYFCNFNFTVQLPKHPFHQSLTSSIPKDALAQLDVMLKDEIFTSGDSPIPSSVKLTVVQSGYTDGGLVPLLSDCNTVDGTLCLQLQRNYVRQKQRVFGVSWDRPNLARKQSFVVVKGMEAGDIPVLWVGQVILLFHLHHPFLSKPKQYVFVQFMEVTQPLSKIDEVLGCVCLRWATGDKIDHTIPDVNSRQPEHIETAEWYGLLPFESILGTVNVLRSNIPIQPFTPKIPWPMHRFYVNRFYKHSASDGDTSASDSRTQTRRTQLLHSQIVQMNK